MANVHLRFGTIDFKRTLTKFSAICSGHARCAYPSRSYNWQSFSTRKIKSQLWRPSASTLRYHWRNIEQDTRASSAAGLELYKKPEVALVVFDKDGTLICCNSLYIPWAKNIAKELQKKTGLQVERKIYRALGFCHFTEKITPGILTEGSISEVTRMLVNVLNCEGLRYKVAKDVVEKAIQKYDPGDPRQLNMLDDLSILFTTLHEFGIKTAVCTDDTRRGTVNALRRLQISHMVDKIVCGDDLTSLPKPSPHNLLMICDSLHVDPQMACYIGDRKVDMQMAEMANFKMRVGALTGVGSDHDLSFHSTHIVDSVIDILPLIFPQRDDLAGQTTPGCNSGDEIEGNSIGSSKSEVASSQETASKQDKKYSLVIFDKDGTLICFHSMWTPWALEYARRLEKATKLKLSSKVLDVLGVCNVNEKIKPGVLAEGTSAQVQEELLELLVKEGLPPDEARFAIEQANESEETVHRRILKSIGDVVGLFRLLKKNGIKTAVCTADNRESTLITLRQLGILDYVDKIICGDDWGTLPKPSPHNALLICESLQVDPADTVMVGDTKADIGMGKSAQLGATIGVLSGVASKLELDNFADYVVPSVKDIIPIVLPNVQSSSEDTGMDELRHHTGNISGGIFGSSVLARGGMKASSSRAYSTFRPGTQKSTTYSHIIVGAGSAGCVLSNRLTANPNNNVLLLEAGPKDQSWKIDMPAALMYNLCNDKYNWYYHTEPQAELNNRVMYWPRGRVWGGSSVLNAMVYVRGHAFDYDRWESEGAESWSYADCLPYFRKAQTHELGPNDYRGGTGPLHVSRGTSDSPLHEAFIQAGIQAGFPFTDDMNGYQQEGFGWMDMTIHKGQRWSAAVAYLRPVLYRTNLITENKALTRKILFSGNRAIGVEYEQKGQTKRVFADEIILSGGAINSPQLLMLSGIGNADHLKTFDIPVVAHLPGVGENLQDHLEVYFQQECTKPITLYSAQWKFPHNMVLIGLEWFLRRTGKAATAHLESGAFIKSHPDVEHPDIQYHFLPSTVNDHGRKSGSCHAFQAHVGTMRSQSKGYLTLKSSNPHDHPRIDPKYMTAKDDYVEFRQCIRSTREIFSQKAFNEFRGKELAPGADVQTDEQIDAFVKAESDSSYHPSCTCKMGASSDPMAVVDNRCQVFGVEGLRIVDASIMPSIVSGNLNGPTIMIAEKASDIILGVPPLPKSNAAVYKPEKDVKGTLNCVSMKC